MKALSRALAAASALALPLLAVPHSADGAPVRRARPHAVMARPAAPSTAIIPLPLQPIVPPAQRLCASRTPTGLGYTVLRPATGAKPGDTDTVLINYIGYLATTGAVFDQAMRTPLQVGQVIKGFSQGLQMMSKASVLRLCIPANLGYGTRVSGPIPANSDLVFQIELVDFRTAAEIEKMRSEQAAEAPADKGATPQQ